MRMDFDEIWVGMSKTDSLDEMRDKVLALERRFRRLMDFLDVEECEVGTVIRKRKAGR